MQHPGPPPGRSATWIVSTAILVYLAYSAAITWIWFAASAPRGATSLVVIGLFAVSTMGCIAQAIGTGSRHGGRPTYYAMNRDGAWAPYVSLFTPRSVAAGPAIGAAMLAVVIAGLFVRQGSPTALEVVAFAVYLIVANGAVGLSYRHVRDYRRATPAAQQ